MMQKRWLRNLLNILKHPNSFCLTTIIYLHMILQVGQRGSEDPVDTRYLYLPHKQVHACNLQQIISVW